VESRRKCQAFGESAAKRKVPAKRKVAKRAKRKGQEEGAGRFEKRRA